MEKKQILIEILNQISSDEFDWSFSNEPLSDETTIYDYLHVQSAICVMNQELTIFDRDDLNKIKEANFKIAKHLTSIFKIQEAFNHFNFSYNMSVEINENKDDIDVINKQNELGMAYIRLAKIEKASECFSNSNQMIKRLNINNELNVKFANSLFNLGKSYLEDNRNYKTAFNYLTSCLDFFKKIYENKDHRNIARAIHLLANCHEKLENEQESVYLFIEAYEMRSRLFKNIDHLDLAESLQALAMCHSRLNNYVEGEKYLKKCYEMKLRLNKNSIYHPSIADIINLMGVFYARFGYDFDSLNKKLESYHIMIELYGANMNERVIAQLLYNIAISYARCGDDLNALDYKSRSFEMRKQLFDGVDLNKPDIIQSIIGLVVSHLRLGHQDLDSELNDYFLQIYQIKSNLSLENQSLLHYYLAVYFGIKKDYEKCFLNAKESYDIRQNSNKDNICIAFSLTQLSIYFEKQSKLEDSLKYELDSFEMKKRLYSEIKMHPFLAHSMTNLSIIYQAMNDYKNSLKFEIESCKMKENLLNNKCHPMLADSYVRLSILYKILNKIDLSETYYSKATKMRLKLYETKKTLSYLKVIKTKQDLNLNENSSDYCSRIFNFI